MVLSGTVYKAVSQMGKINTSGCFLKFFRIEDPEKFEEYLLEGKKKSLPLENNNTNACVCLSVGMFCLYVCMYVCMYVGM